MAMTEEKTDQEPSMEEILSSIRRIISSDGEEGEATPEAAVKPEAVEPEVTPEADEAEGEGVLELTGRVDEPDPEPEPEP
ncbi:MAG: DUF2497 domain-containing protein, partial [Alphaproteobacteria bacterium]